MLVLLLAIAGCGGPERPPKPRVNPRQTGRIDGFVRFVGIPPPPVKVAMSSADCRVHGDVMLREVEAREGNLAGAFVWVKSGADAYAWDPPEYPVELDQKRCMFEPRVLALSTGQTLRMKNSDGMMHNVHAETKVNDVYNRAFPTKGDQESTTFPEPEVMIRLRCDIHPWMTAWVGVTAHPFRAATSVNGAYAFDGVPAGEVVVAVWHETLGTRETRINLKPMEMKRVDFEFEKMR